MGDHRIGKAMRDAANIWWGSHPTPTQQDALAALDTICGPYRKRDAEFESEDPKRPGYIHPDYDQDTDPDGPIGRLIAIAFDAKPDEMSLGDADTYPWYDGPFSRFNKRYEFC